LIEVIATLQRQLEAAKQRIAELEKNAGGPPPSASAKVDEPFSMRAEEKRQTKRGHNKPKLSKKGRRGRLTSADKLKLAERTEKCFPENVSEKDCQLSHTRPVWRLENGRAVLIAYEIYRGPKSQYGQIDGVLGRSEFGMEIVVEIAYLVYQGLRSTDHPNSSRPVDFVKGRGLRFSWNNSIQGGESWPHLPPLRQARRLICRFPNTSPS
jgi:hypothetical protein